MKRSLILIAALAVVGCRYQYNSHEQCGKPSPGAVTDVTSGSGDSPTPEKTPDMTSEERGLGMQGPLPITNGGVGCPTELWVFDYETVPLVNAQTGENPMCSYILQNKDGDVMISIVTYPNVN